MNYAKQNIRDSNNAYRNSFVATIAWNTSIG